MDMAGYGVFQTVEIRSDLFFTVYSPGLFCGRNGIFVVCGGFLYEVNLLCAKLGTTHIIGCNEIFMQSQ